MTRAKGPTMERITITIGDDLLESFDRLIEDKGYANRSEGIRDAIRNMLAGETVSQEDQGECVGCVVYLFNHTERLLSKRLTEAHHHHHEIPAATLHMHVDEENCLEATILKGTVQDVQQLANQITSETGVRHGHLHLIPLEKESG